jgi:hypothetical protein
MSAYATKRAGILAAVLAAGALTLGIGSPVANAADDCGYGLHFDNGVCIQNLPGSGARFDPGHPNCWINDNGDQRCY